MTPAITSPNHAIAVQNQNGALVAAAGRYSLAFFSVLAAVLLSLVLKHFQVHDVEVPVFLFAVAISAWYGGPGAAVLALLLSCLSFDYFFVEPYYTLYITLADVPYFVAFSMFALLVSWFTALRRRVEAELRRTQNNLTAEVVKRTEQASLLDLTHDTIFVRDMSNVITYWNRGAQEMYGWSSQEALGKSAHDLLRAVFSQPIDTIRETLLRTGRWDGEIETTRSDGTKMLVASRWSLRRDENQRPVAILETNNDITQRKKWEQASTGKQSKILPKDTLPDLPQVPLHRRRQSRLSPHSR